MKKLLIWTIGLLISTANLFAQHGSKHIDVDKFKADKVAFITTTLNLTPEEAQAFWPIYNEFDKKKWELIKEHRKISDIMSEGIDGKSDEEYIDLSRKFSSIKSMEGKLASDYNEKFLEVLPPKKVVQLYKVEYDFRRNMLRNYRNIKTDKEKNGDRPPRP